MRNTSESKRAPSWRARTWVTTPESRTGSPRPGSVALADDDVVELQVLVLGERDPERQRRGVLGAEDPPDGLDWLMRLRAQALDHRVRSLLPPRLRAAPDSWERR